MNVTAVIMNALSRDKRPMSIQEIAAREGMSYNTVRVHLKSMELVGLVSSARPDMRRPSQWWVAERRDGAQ